MMNGLSIVVAAIFLLCVFWGYRRGFIKIVASLAATLATIILVIFLSPYVSDMILKVVPIEKTIQEKCISILQVQTESETGEAVILEDIETSRETQISLIENAEIPEVFRQLLLENNNDEIYQTLGVTTFTEYVGSYLAKLVADIISFLLTLIIVTIVIRTITYTLGIISKLPVVGGMNRLAGGILGIGTGLVVVWILFVILTLIYDTEIGTLCFTHIAESEFLTKLYNNNILMNYITKFRA